MAPNNKKLLIVGAGASGLPSLRHALLYGIDVTCFERTKDVGGLWHYKPQETECECNFSKLKRRFLKINSGFILLFPKKHFQF